MSLITQNIFKLSSKTPWMDGVRRFHLSPSMCKVQAGRYKVRIFVLRCLLKEGVNNVYYSL